MVCLQMLYFFLLKELQIVQVPQLVGGSGPSALLKHPGSAEKIT